MFSLFNTYQIAILRCIVAIHKLGRYYVSPHRPQIRIFGPSPRSGLIVNLVKKKRTQNPENVVCESTLSRM